MREDLVFSVEGIDPDVAVFTEPAACAMHGLETLAMRPGGTALVLGAGPTGLLLAQLIRTGGAASVTVAAPTQYKLDTAGALGIDQTVLIDRVDMDGNQAPPPRGLGGNGYDYVVEATGSTDVGGMCVPLTRNGGTVLVYGVTRADETVSFHPFDVFRREITIKGSFAEMTSFGAAIRALRSGRARTDGIITHRFSLGTTARPSTPWRTTARPTRSSSSSPPHAARHDVEPHGRRTWASTWARARSRSCSWTGRAGRVRRPRPPYGCGTRRPAGPRALRTDWWKRTVHRGPRGAGPGPGGPSGQHRALGADARRGADPGRTARPVRHALLWADSRADRRARPLPAACRRRRGGAWPTRSARGWRVPSSRGSSATSREATAAMRWALQPKDWLRFRLTGEVHTEPSDASATLMYDVLADAWAEDVVDALGVDPRVLPRCCRRPGRAPDP